MVGDDAAHAATAWLSRDSFVPIHFPKSKSPNNSNTELDGQSCRDVTAVGKLDSGHLGANLIVQHPSANIPLQPNSL